LQVKHAVEADIKVSFLEAGDNAATNLSATEESQRQSLQPLPCRLHVVKQGPRCYTDASLAPDCSHINPRNAGLGVFLLDPVKGFNFYIKASLQNSSSIIMVESAAMALAADVTSLLNISDMSFITDNQILATFYNGDNFDQPPSWDVRPFTQRFLHKVSHLSWRVMKIGRGDNITAHTLASQALRATTQIPNQDVNNHTVVTCSNEDHVDGCPLKEALNLVNWETFSLIAASCC